MILDKGRGSKQVNASSYLQLRPGKMSTCTLLSYCVLCAVYKC